jgi:hypothetical protein
MTDNLEPRLRKEFKEYYAGILKKAFDFNGLLDGDEDLKEAIIDEVSTFLMEKQMKDTKSLR